MTIERDGSHCLVTCDDCGDSAEMEGGDVFQQSWNDLKESGWIAYKTGDWQHRCPACAKPKRAKDWYEEPK